VQRLVLAVTVASVVPAAANNGIASDAWSNARRAFVARSKSPN